MAHACVDATSRYNRRVTAPLCRGTARVLGIALALALARPVAAQESPRWELGLGVGVLRVPDYRGADQSQTWVAPLPYITYRSPRVNLDREGLRVRVWGREDLRLGLSAGVGFPARSSHNAARTGMRDLDATLEIGPSLDWRIARLPSRSLWLKLPVRAVVAANLRHAQDEGAIFAPQVVLTLHGSVPGGHLDLATGPLFANERYHDYYYQVTPQDATPARPAYDARAGYSGWRASLGASERVHRWWYGAYLRYDDLHGAVFEDSPLVRRRSAWVLGVGVAYVLVHSADAIADP